MVVNYLKQCSASCQLCKILTGRTPHCQYTPYAVLEEVMGEIWKW